ncbi:uncharacterized protein LOC123536743 isoform X2 [Mercenaria mercenaria]|nr:uncharacterized protein LOC123536743 isoform X2 [Mercenaria mercenaria]XP_045176067.2 uncharacterized protein LOC123536743 isoform X2 [Mercenaria mercenaria]
MDSGRSTLGRVFCVTGMQSQSHEHVQSATPSLMGSECGSTNFIGQCDTDSNTSGYLSSSSFESSGEEKRLLPNEQKVFNVWTKWGQQVHIPKSSTPKQGSESIAYRKLAKRVNMTNESGKNVLCIKKNFQSNTNEPEVFDSFWDIQTPQRVQRSSSEGDVNNMDKKTNDDWKRKSVQAPITHDAGQEIVKNNKLTKSQDWKRKPFLTLSDSQLDLRLCAPNHNATRKSSAYSALPRYRVKVDADPVVTKNKLVQQLTKSCADFVDEGVPVDESMSEFLSNVDRENLASFLNFYDKVTNSSASYEKARRNPNNYEAVYY